MASEGSAAAAAPTAAALEELWHELEARRRRRLLDLGVAEAAIAASRLAPTPRGEVGVGKRFKGSGAVRVMQFNVLAEAMANDGFLVRPVMAEWPIDHDSMPTTDGFVVEFSDMLQEVMQAKGKEETMAALKVKYDVQVARRNLEAVVDSEARVLQLQLGVLSTGCPDIIVMQEVDTFGRLSVALSEFGYASQLPGKSAPYVPAHLSGQGDRRCGDAAEVAFLRHFQDSGHTFLPKLGSTAMSIRLRGSDLGKKLPDAAAAAGVAEHVCDKDSGKLKKAPFLGLPGGSDPLLRACGMSDPASIDDDGVAIFWRRDRFEATSMQAHFNSENFSAIEVRLKARDSGRTIIVLGTHLGSGDTPKDETSRLEKQVLKEEGLAAWARSLRQEVVAMGAGEDRAAVLLVLDANAHPQLRALDGESNVWGVLRDAVGASVWDAYFDEKGSERAAEGSGLDAPVTTNKLRGFASDQVRKIGSHAYHAIDHIFFNPEGLELRGHAELGQVGRVQRYKSKEAAVQDMLPSLVNPSDHFPVVVDLQWRESP